MRALAVLAPAAIVAFGMVVVLVVGAAGDRAAPVPVAGAVPPRVDQVPAPPAAITPAPAAARASERALRDVVAFGRTAKARDVDRLVAMAHVADPVACSTAIAALARLDLLARLGDLGPWLRDERLRVRQELVLACERSDDPEHLAILSAAAADGDERVRALAAVALARRQPGTVRTAPAR